MSTPSTPTSDNRVQFRADRELETWLRDRARRRFELPSLTQNVQTELGMWRDCLRVDQQRIRWTLEELQYIAGVLNGSALGFMVGPLIAMEIHDTVSIDEEEGDPAADVAHTARAKAARLSATGDLATRDAIARWWADPQRGSATEPATWTALGFRLVQEG